MPDWVQYVLIGLPVWFLVACLVGLLWNLLKDVPEPDLDALYQAWVENRRN